MSGSVDKAMLISNLGRDREVKSFQNGSRVANLSVATSESRKDNESGERREKVDKAIVKVRPAEQFSRTRSLPVSHGGPTGPRCRGFRNGALC